MSQAAAQTYTPGYGSNAVAFMAKRRAQTHAAFFVPLLRNGMRVLDCGCGPGAITLDLARIVRPGEVIGIDCDGEQFSAASDTAARERLALRFETGSVYALPFAENSFDAIFVHALFEHLAEPARAASEIHRVLKPGGVCGLRSPDWGGVLLYPLPEGAAAAIRDYEVMMAANGGDIHAGRKLPALLRAVGFAPVKPSATYEIYDDPADIAEYLARQLECAQGGAEPAAALRRWACHLGAMFAQAWVEALGWKVP
jgi:SAM-dependent methyltransferase